jgi:hypothetical protein
VDAQARLAGTRQQLATPPAPEGLSATGTPPGGAQTQPTLPRP